MKHLFLKTVKETKRYNICEKKQKKHFSPLCRADWFNQQRLHQSTNQIVGKYGRVLFNLYTKQQQKKVLQKPCDRNCSPPQQRQQREENQLRKAKYFGCPRIMYSLEVLSTNQKDQENVNNHLLLFFVYLLHSFLHNLFPLIFVKLTTFVVWLQKLLHCIDVFLSAEYLLRRKRENMIYIDYILYTKAQQYSMMFNVLFCSLLVAITRTLDLYYKISRDAMLPKKHFCVSVLTFSTCTADVPASIAGSPLCAATLLTLVLSPQSEGADFRICGETTPTGMDDVVDDVAGLLLLLVFFDADKNLPSGFSEQGSEEAGGNLV